MYIVAIAALALWFVMLMTGTTFDGLIHVLLVVMAISILMAAIKQNRELMG